jgi:CDP-diacylglycerol--serine O-phosphatidyltransferase
MRSVTRHIPNFITCMNLLSGCFGIMLLIYDGINKCSGATLLAGYCVFFSAFFDFFDGLVARALKVASAIGKDLDSLADVVSFGVLPALLSFKVFFSIHASGPADKTIVYISLIFLLIPVLSALRLAKFNNDKSQSYSFKGLPTPANGLILTSIAIYILSLGDIFNYYRFRADETADAQKSIPEYASIFAEVYTNKIFMLAFPVVLSILLVTNIPLISMKLHNFSLRNYAWHFVLLILSVVAALLFGFASAPIILVLYLLISFIHFRFNNHEIQSGN